MSNNELSTSCAITNTHARAQSHLLSLSRLCPPKPRLHHHEHVDRASVGHLRPCGVGETGTRHQSGEACPPYDRAGVCIIHMCDGGVAVGIDEAAFSTAPWFAYAPKEAELIFVRLLTGSRRSPTAALGDDALRAVSGRRRAELQKRLTFQDLGGLNLNSSNSGCARLGSGVAPPLGVVKEEVAVLFAPPSQVITCKPN